jgi:hypothetical protein
MIALPMYQRKADAFEMTDDVRRVLVCRNATNRIAVAIDCDVAEPGDLTIISQLVREGFLSWIDRMFLRRPGINVDIYKLSLAGVALCEKHGISQGVRE